MASLKFGVIRKWVNEKGWRKHLLTILSVLLIIFESKTLNNLLNSYTDMERELANLEETINKSALVSRQASASQVNADKCTSSMDREGNLISEVDLKMKLSKTELELIKSSSKENPVNVLLYSASKTFKAGDCNLETEVVSASSK